MATRAQHFYDEVDFGGDTTPRPMLTLVHDPARGIFPK